MMAWYVWISVSGNQKLEDQLLLVRTGKRLFVWQSEWLLWVTTMLQLVLSPHQICHYICENRTWMHISCLLSKCRPDWFFQKLLTYWAHADLKLHELFITALVTHIYTPHTWTPEHYICHDFPAMLVSWTCFIVCRFCKEVLLMTRWVYLNTLSYKCSDYCDPFLYVVAMNIEKSDQYVATFTSPCMEINWWGHANVVKRAC